MDRALERQVRQRAGARCEYCHFPEALAELPFQFDHIIARQHGGQTEAQNLALVCCFCNRYKGPNLSGIDLTTGEVVRLFDPRQLSWDEHFRWNGPVLLGISAVGRATIHTLKINWADAILLRQILFSQSSNPFG